MQKVSRFLNNIQLPKEHFWKDIVKSNCISDIKAVTTFGVLANT